jgi:hypothetical protein
VVDIATSDDGPVCPGCGRQFTTDEPSYYDESGFELECDACPVVFHVTPAASWMWTSKLVRRQETKDE